MKLLIAILLLISPVAFAGRFGGSRSSYSGRSYSAPIRRSAPAYHPAPHTVVVEHYHNNSGGGSFLTNMLIWNALSNHNHETVVVQNGTAPLQQTAVAPPQESSHFLLWTFVLVMIVIGFCILVV